MGGGGGVGGGIFEQNPSRGKISSLIHSLPSDAENGGGGGGSLNRIHQEVTLVL